MNLRETILSIRPPDAAARARARERLDSLLMPHWALGRLMDLAEDLCAMTGRTPPPVARKLLAVFAADHGVCAQGVSRYPSAVTPIMVRSFIQGKAAVNALARAAGAQVLVVDMGMAAPFNDVSRTVLSRRAGAGTEDISRGHAMSRETARFCLEAGIRVAEERAEATDVFATGDMGIGNTTPSAAITAVMTGRPVEQVTGHGTGIDAVARARKVAVIESALALNRPDARDGLDVLAKVGGFEIGAIAGLILGAAARRKPVVIDGFISGAGALIAQSLCPDSMSYVVAGHRSAEPGHHFALEKLGKTSLLALEMRLGEGSGAALAMPLLDAAARLMTEVATFEEAGIPRAAAEPGRP